MKITKYLMLFLTIALSFVCTMSIVHTTGLDTISSACVTLGFIALMEFISAKMGYGLSFVGTCGTITASILADCDNPVQGGTRDRAYIMNFDDFDLGTIVFGADGYTIEAITLPALKTAFVIEGKNNSIVPKATMVEQGFSNMFDQEINMKGFDISPTVKKDLNSMKDGRFVIITENYFKGTSGNSAFEVYGTTVGLEMTVIERDPNNTETQGAFDMTFFTKLNKEPNLPNPLFLTDYTTTKAIAEGLL